MSDDDIKVAVVGTLERVLFHPQLRPRRPVTRVGITNDVVTERKRAILFFVTAYWREHGYAPRIGEVVRGAGLCRSCLYDGPHPLLTELVEDGFLAYAPGKLRTLRAAIPFVLLGDAER